MITVTATKKKLLTRVSLNVTLDGQEDIAVLESELTNTLKAIDVRVCSINSGSKLHHLLIHLKDRLK